MNPVFLRRKFVRINNIFYTKLDFSLALIQCWTVSKMTCTHWQSWGYRVNGLYSSVSVVLFRNGLSPDVKLNLSNYNLISTAQTQLCHLKVQQQYIIFLLFAIMLTNLVSIITFFSWGCWPRVSWRRLLWQVCWCLIISHGGFGAKVFPFLPHVGFLHSF